MGPKKTFADGRWPGVAFGYGSGREVATKERLMRIGFYDLANAYQSLHVNYFSVTFYQVFQ